jgi:calcineurin-like phosphoesterase family protein
MTTYVTSDCHFGHKNIIKYEPVSRPFSSIEEMDEVLIERWNSKVKENDEIYILGDFSFHKVNKTVEILGRLSGKKCLIVGNHDNHLINHDPFKEMFVGYYDLLDNKIAGKHYVMCHYPLLSWNRSHYGSVNLFGHLHSSWKGNRQQLNVGMDCHNLYPIAFEEIDSLLAALPERSCELHTEERL